VVPLHDPEVLDMGLTESAGHPQAQPPSPQVLTALTGCAETRESQPVFAATPHAEES
jgi:hypothetical protein